MIIPPFRYLSWIKERLPRARICLALSGMDHPPESVFPLHRLSYRLDIPDSRGYPPLVERIAHHLGVDRERVIVVPGCTYAAHLGARCLVQPGETALVENPTYELMVRLPELWRARVRRFQRRMDDAFALPWEQIEAAVDGQIAALFLTVPHNPSGRLLSDDEVAELAARAEAHDFMVLTDEVYLDFFPSALRTYRSLAAVSDRFVVSGSLTKAHGLANLRLGWLAGPPEVIREARRLNEYMADRIPAFESQAGVLAFDHMGALLERAYATRRRNFPIVEAWADAHPGIDLLDPGAGITTLVRIPEDIDSLGLAEDLLTRDGVLVAPADMFGSKGFVRISFGIDGRLLSEGLDALSRALARALSSVG